MPNYYKVEQLEEQSTTSSNFIDIPGTTLTWTPEETSEIWVIFATGVIRSSSTNQRSMEFILDINGNTRDLFSHHNNRANTPNGAGFCIFDYITDTIEPQTAKLRYRANNGTTYCDSIRLVAIKVPPHADFQFNFSDDIIQTNGNNINILSLNFTPNNPGNYIIFGKVSHREFPSNQTSQAWFEGSDGVKHPHAPTDIHYSNASDAWNPLTSAWQEYLDASPQTFLIKFTSGQRGNQTSEHTYRKLMAFRIDAWDKLYYHLDSDVSYTTSSNFITKNSLTTSVPIKSSDYLSIQLARIAGTDGSGQDQKSGELQVNGTTKMRTNHLHRNRNQDINGYHHIIGYVDVHTTSNSQTYTNGFLSPTGETVECAESVIIVLKYDDVDKETHQMFL